MLSLYTPTGVLESIDPETESVGVVPENTLEPSPFLYPVTV